MKIFFLAILILALPSFTHAGTKEYTVGSGSEFQFNGDKGDKISLSIYITESSFTKLGIEYFFTTGGLLATETWQQYRLGITEKGMTLEEGYILSSQMTKPEIMTKAFRENNDGGVKVEDFFFTKEADIERYKLGVETVEVPAGSILTTHYQKKRERQTVDFWISDKAGVIGLVKLISKGDEGQNYKIELQSLLKHVKAKINPAESVPLTDKGKEFLGNKNK